MYPFIHVTDSFIIPTYILILSLTYSLGLVGVDLRAKARDLSRGMALDISLALMVGGFLGARIFHVVYEQPERYWAQPLEILKFWNGGFVFYGGFLGALVATALFIRLKKESFLFWADFFAPILSFGYAFGRLGCFFNGCCFGKTCDLPWAIEFNHPGLPLGLRHPTQIYASLTEFIIMGFLLWYERGERPSKRGTLFFIWLILHALNRLFMESFRDDYRGPQFGLSVSTWMSLCLLIVAGGFLMFHVEPIKKK